MKNKMLKTSCTANTELEFNEVTELFICLRFLDYRTS